MLEITKDELIKKIYVTQINLTCDNFLANSKYSVGTDSGPFPSSPVVTDGLLLSAPAAEGILLEPVGVLKRESVLITCCP
jgi:hypothetical protein